MNAPFRLATVAGICLALGACGPAYRDYASYGSSAPTYGYYDPGPSYSPYYAPTYRSYNTHTPFYSTPRYEPRHARRSCHRDGGSCDRDDNPPGPRGGPGTNWENPPGPAGGPGASPDRRSAHTGDRDDDRRRWRDRR